jgi:hypothetical protein
MSGSTGWKIFVTVLFVLVGLPPGLCSLYGMGVVLSVSGQLDSEGWQFAQLFVVPSLVGLAFFGGMLWWLIWTWRRSAP